MAGAGGLPWPEVRADNIDTLSDSFPPCMRQLHHKLRTQHRLRHSARVGITVLVLQPQKVANSFIYCPCIAHVAQWLEHLLGVREAGD